MLAAIEARVRQLQELVEAPTPTVTGKNSPLSAAPKAPKEGFGAALFRAAGPSVAGALTSPPHEGVHVAPGGVAPVTMPVPAGVGDAADRAEAIVLDPDEAVRRDRVLPFIREAAHKTGLSEALITAVIEAESSFNPGTVSSAGAMGLMQLMPENVRELGVANAFDPRQNILAGARHLRDQVDRFGALDKALAAYNAGPGNVERYGGVPPYRETQNYVRKITDALRQAGATP